MFVCVYRCVYMVPIQTHVHKHRGASSPVEPSYRPTNSSSTEQELSFPSSLCTEAWVVYQLED